MDTLHKVLRALHPASTPEHHAKSDLAKSDPAGKEHLRVFQEFLSHLDHIARQTPARPTRVKSPRAVTRKSVRSTRKG